MKSAGFRPLILLFQLYTLISLHICLVNESFVWFFFYKKIDLEFKKGKKKTVSLSTGQSKFHSTKGFISYSLPSQIFFAKHRKRIKLAYASVGMNELSRKKSSAYKKPIRVSMYIERIYVHRSNSYYHWNVTGERLGIVLFLLFLNVFSSFVSLQMDLTQLILLKDVTFDG